MKYKLSNKDSLLLKAFITCRIPSYIRETVLAEIDLMECYEELFNYSHALINGYAIDLEKNSLKSGSSFIFNEVYKEILVDLISNRQEPDIVIHACLSLAVLVFLEGIRA